MRAPDAFLRRDWTIGGRPWGAEPRSWFPAHDRRQGSERANPRDEGLQGLAPDPAPSCWVEWAVSRLPADHAQRCAPSALLAMDSADQNVKVEYWVNENAILVHPAMNGPVLGILEGLELQNAVAITAAVNVHHAS